MFRAPYQTSLQSRRCPPSPLPRALEPRGPYSPCSPGERRLPSGSGPARKDPTTFSLPGYCSQSVLGWRGWVTCYRPRREVLWS